MYEIFLITHIIGAILGAGGAFVSDALFFGTLSDRKIEKNELRMLITASKTIWTGLVVTVASGLAMLIASDFVFLGGAKLQAKLIIIGIIIVNGIIFHAVHIPFMEKLTTIKQSLRKGSVKNISWWKMRCVFASGSISLVSWLSVVVLGSYRGVQPSLGFLMMLYGILIAGALVVGQIIFSRMFKNDKKITLKKSGAFARGAWIYIIILAISALLLAGTLFISQKSNNSSNRTDTAIKLTQKSEMEIDTTGKHASYTPNVPPASTNTKQQIFEVHIEVLEGACPLDPENGVTFEMWGYRIAGDTEINCGSPGPTLRGRVGDVARITLTNLPGNVHPHNIDFHSVTGQGGGARDLTVAPGETASIEVRLLYPGTFMYHCAYGDVPVHISRGMYGMFIVDPAEPLPVVDHEWAIMQSEWYTTPPTSDTLVDLDRQAILDENPTFITFNGRVDALTGDNMLKMNVGERARIYFVNQGLSLNSNFHPIGSHWDIVYPEGATHPANTVIHGSQSTLVVTGGGTVVELVAQVPSDIILVDHALSRTFYKGAKGIIRISGPENPEIYESIETNEDLPHGHNGELESTETVNVTIPVGAAMPGLADKAFSPQNITVEVGTTVTWTNTDSVMHTVTSGNSNGSVGSPDGKFNSGFLKKGDTFSYTFNETGVFPYHCTPHPWATGTITVTQHNN
ncbi:MAG: plastocyanin/azurin family copper-binding protein [Candidatus Nomurabacteria bacterium]|nr:plastocyanin/azurin family copper-binding protein [Candidatus Nomurabacteria bacterium]